MEQPDKEENPSYPCRQCGLKFVKPESLEIHESAHLITKTRRANGTTKKTHRCVHCSLKFTMHAIKAHEAQCSWTLLEKEKYSRDCKYCNLKYADIESHEAQCANLSKYLTKCDLEIALNNFKKCNESNYFLTDPMEPPQETGPKLQPHREIYNQSCKHCKLLFTKTSIESHVAKCFKNSKNVDNCNEEIALNNNEKPNETKHLVPLPEPRTYPKNTSGQICKYCSLKLTGVDMKSHEAQCFNPSKHLENDTLLQKEKQQKYGHICKHCSLRFPTTDIESHKAKCLEASKDGSPKKYRHICTFCNQKIALNNIKTHVLNCSKRQEKEKNDQTCKHCSLRFTWTSIKHHEAKCSKHSREALLHLEESVSSKTRIGFRGNTF